MQSSFLLVLYIYVGGSFASFQRRRPRRALGDSCHEPNSSRTLKGGRCASRAQLQRRPCQKRLGRSPHSNIANVSTKPLPLFKGGWVREKCSANWTRTRALSPKWHVGKTDELWSTRDEQHTSDLKTTRRRPPPPYDAHLPRRVMTFQ